MEIYNQDRLKQVKDFRNGAVVTPGAMSPQSAVKVPLGPMAPPPAPAPSKPMGNTAIGDWARSPDRGDSEFARFMRGGEKLGDRPAIVPQKPQYTAPVGAPAPASSLGTLGMAPVVTMPEPAIQGPTVASAAGLPPVGAPPRAMSSLATAAIDRSLPAVSSLPARPAADLSGGTMAIRPGQIPASQKGVYVNGVLQPSAMPGTDPRALQDFNNQNIAQANIQAKYPDANPNMGYVGQASSNVPGTRAINMGGMAAVDEALAALAAGGGQQAPAWDQAGIDAAKNDPARQVAFEPGAREEQGKPFFVRAPSRQERMAGIAGDQAIRLAGVQGGFGVKIAQAGANANAAIKDADRKNALELQDRKNKGLKEANGAQVIYDDEGNVVGISGKGSLAKTAGMTKADADSQALIDQSVRDIAAYDDTIRRNPGWTSAQKDEATVKRNAEIAVLKRKGYNPDGSPLDGSQAIDASIPRDAAAVRKTANEGQKVRGPDGKTYIIKNGEPVLLAA